MRHVRLTVVAAAAAVMCAGVWPAAGHAQVLYRTPSRVSELTATAGQMAWAQERPHGGCFTLYRRAVAAIIPTRVTGCRLVSSHTFAWIHRWVRMTGANVFWSETGSGNTEVDEWTYSTLPGGRRSPTVYTINCGGSAGAGKLLGPIAAGALAYSVFQVTTDGACDPLSGTGVVRRIVVTAGGAVTHPLVPGAPGAALIAQSGRDLLEVPGTFANFELAPTTTLELRGARSGALRWSVPFTGTARAAELSQRYAVTLVRPSSGSPRIRAYALGSGVLVRSLALRPTALPMVAVAGPRVIFAYPRAIMIWNVRRNVLRVLRTTASAAHNLAVDDRLVVWNTPHTIRGVRLPRAAP